jgi:hypothetical protein
MMAESQIVEHGEAAISQQQCGKCVSAIMNKHATYRNNWEAVFSVQYIKRPYSEKPAAVSCTKQNYTLRLK